MAHSHELWYRRSARAWEEALPVGNGRIGGMVFGGVSRERIALNEDSLWSGYPRDTDNAEAGAHYAAVQELALAGKYREAEELIETRMEGKYTQSYMPLGDIIIEFSGTNEEESTKYRRSLRLDDALALTEYSLGGVGYKSACFVSKPDQALIYRIEADIPGALSARISLASPLRSESRAEGNMLILTGRCPSYAAPSYLKDIKNAIIYDEEDERKFGMRFCGIALIDACGGSVESGADGVLVSRANSVTIKFCARTSYNGFDRHPFTDGRDEIENCYADIEAVAPKNYDDILENHLRDFRPLFDRVSFELGGPIEDISTGDRLVRFSETRDDPALFELIFHYGRYLMLTASREGTAAMNLQGIWNQSIRPPWSSNYTININTQMNYWPAEPCGMGDMHLPLFDLIEKLTASGAKTARVAYNAGGSVSHHNTDIWGLSNAVGESRRGTAKHAFWPMSFGWLCRHLFEHYEYSLDEDFLKNRAFPAIAKACEFYLDVLRDDGEGHLCVTPATSPENSFYVDGAVCSVAKSAAMSDLIVRESFENLLKCAEILNIENDLTLKARAALEKIKPCEIGSQGQLLEWNDEFDEPEPRHRHVSHLYGFYPCDMLTLEDDPALADACRRSLELRGDDGTGWSLGWKINLWARLGDGGRALKLLERQLQYVPADEERLVMGGGGTYLNLFDAHPPFQIDGNFSAVSGIAEMLLQCKKGKILLLPALPLEWRDGRISGLMAKGGYKIDVSFRNGKLLEAVIEPAAKNAGEAVICYNGRQITLATSPGVRITLNEDSF